MNPLPDRLPLVIGVTGHRDLRDQDVPTLEREIAAIIERLRHDYLHGNAETPLIVLSSLAEGADRLVARVALAHGARLVAPMPMPIEEYRRDFEPGLKPGNASEFDALLAQAIAAPVMPFTPGNSLAAVRADSAKREEQYRAVGLFIAQHANVLIALWDGDGTHNARGRHRRGRCIQAARYPARHPGLGARKPRCVRDRAGDPRGHAAPKGDERG